MGRCASASESGDLDGGGLRRTKHRRGAESGRRRRRRRVVRRQNVILNGVSDVARPSDGLVSSSRREFPRALASRDTPGPPRPAPFAPRTRRASPPPPPRLPPRVCPTTRCTAPAPDPRAGTASPVPSVRDCTVQQRARRRKVIQEWTGRHLLRGEKQKRTQRSARARRAEGRRCTTPPRGPPSSPVSFVSRVFRSPSARTMHTCSTKSDAYRDAKRRLAETASGGGVDAIAEPPQGR